ncbi:MAG: hypothetical protein WCW25_02335 [Patescibacteria group bacterium]|jgi:hypothetical protein
MSEKRNTPILEKIREFFVRCVIIIKLRDEPFAFKIALNIVSKHFGGRSGNRSAKMFILNERLLKGKVKKSIPA